MIFCDEYYVADTFFSNNDAKVHHFEAETKQYISNCIDFNIIYIKYETRYNYIDFKMKAINNKATQFDIKRKEVYFQSQQS